MLVHSNKPQILRLHNLEEKQRNKFCSDFNSALIELLPSSLNKSLNSSSFLKKLMETLPDLYYTFITVYYCRRRLGEEYTYIAMYKQKHYAQEGVLMNKKTRLLLCLLQLISRNLFVPLFSKILNFKGGIFDMSQKSSGTQKRQKFWTSLRNLAELMKEGIVQLLGNAQQIMSNMEWLILMVYMLDWNKHFTFIETLLGIRYVYTYKNDQIREVSYAIEGYLLLLTLIVKAAKNLYSIFKAKTAKKQSESSNKAETSANPFKKSGKQKQLCRICYDEMKNKSSTKCGHVFCWTCIIKTLQISQQCPVCRSSCHPRQVVQLRNF